MVGSEGPGAGGLDGGQLREAVDQADLVEFGQGLAEGAGVAEIAARKGDHVRHPPAELLHQLEDDGLLAFQAEGVDGVGEVDIVGVGEGAQEGEGLVEVAGDLHDAGAVGDGLAELAAADLAFRDQDQRRHAGRGGVGGEGSGGVASAGAGDDPGADRLGMADADGHAAIFEGAGRVVPLVLESEAARTEPGVGGEAVVPVERGVAFGAADDGGVGDGGQEGAVAPDAGGAQRGRQVPAEVVRVDRPVEREVYIQQATASSTDADWTVAGGSGAADHTAHPQVGQCRRAHLILDRDHPPVPSIPAPHWASDGRSRKQ